MGVLGPACSRDCPDPHEGQRASEQRGSQGDRPEVARPETRGCHAVAGAECGPQNDSAPAGTLEHPDNPAVSQCHRQRHAPVDARETLGQESKGDREELTGAQAVPIITHFVTRDREGWLRGGDLNPRPLGYECDGARPLPATDDNWCPVLLTSLTTGGNSKPPLSTPDCQPFVSRPTTPPS